MTNPESRWDGVKGPDCGAETGNALHNISYCVIEYVWERTVQHLYFSTLSSYISWKIKKITATIFFAVREDTRLLMLTPTWLKVLQVFCTHAHEKIIPRSFIRIHFVGALPYIPKIHWLARIRTIRSIGIFLNGWFPFIYHTRHSLGPIKFKRSVTETNHASWSMPTLAKWNLSD